MFIIHSIPYYSKLLHIFSPISSESSSVFLIFTNIWPNFMPIFSIPTLGSLLYTCNWIQIPKSLIQNLFPPFFHIPKQATNHPLPYKMDKSLCPCPFKSPSVSIRWPPSTLHLSFQHSCIFLQTPFSPSLFSNCGVLPDPDDHLVFFFAKGEQNEHQWESHIISETTVWISLKFSIEGPHQSLYKFNFDCSKSKITPILNKAQLEHSQFSWK
jgi:hypothetical protein